MPANGFVTTGSLHRQKAEVHLSIRARRLQEHLLMQKKQAVHTCLFAITKPCFLNKTYALTQVGAVARSLSETCNSLPAETHNRSVPLSGGPTSIGQVIKFG